MNKFIFFLLLSITSLFAQDNALVAFKHKDYNEAFKLYSIKAKNDDTSALNALSYLYFNGLGTQKNEQKGIELLERSADANNKNAEYDLGMMYLIGSHVNKNHAKAFDYLTEASQHGHLDAKFNLSLMYYNGDATDSNITKTLELLESASSQGHTDSIKNIGRIYMQDFQFEKAVKWLKINVKNGDEEAKYLLQEIYTQKEELKN